jgi:subtilisin family serine protease
MSVRSPRLHRTLVVLLVASLVASVAAPATVAGDLSGGDVDDAGGVSAVSNVSSTVSSSDPPSAVGPGLRSANGTVEVVVRFEDDARVRPSSTGTAEVSTAELKSTAETAQGSFERFAERKPGVTVEQRLWLANAMLVTVDTESVAVERLLEVRGVERVHENFRVEIDSAATATGGPDSAAGPTVGTVSSTSTSTNATYGVDMVRAPAVWDEFDTRGAGATVAVLDTGIDPDHQDLTVSDWAAFDVQGTLVSEGPENASDVNGHGTHVAGTVAGGNASGTAIGVAPEAKLYGVKVLDDSGIGTFTQLVAGMEHVTEEPSVDVIQISLGSEGQFDEYIEPVQQSRNAGKLVIVSAGNGEVGASSSPGNVYESLAVGAVDENRDVASFSAGETLNTSTDWSNETLTADWPDEYMVPDVSAPGVAVPSAKPGDTYGTESGTSMAAPHVSGVAALLIAASTRDITDQELYDTLRDTATHPDGSAPDTRYGAGIVDGYAAASSITENRSNLTVTAFDAPNETVPGATVETTATINNTGVDPGTGTVEYRFDGTVGDETTVSLAAGENETVSFSYILPRDTATNRTYEHGVYTNDTNLTSGLSVVDGPLHEVTDLSAPPIVERNATLRATANVTNRPGQRATTGASNCA